MIFFVSKLAVDSGVFFFLCYLLVEPSHGWLDIYQEFFCELISGLLQYVELCHPETATYKRQEFHDFYSNTVI